MSDDIARALGALPARVNASGTLVRIGRYCTTAFLWEIGDRPFHLAIERGRLVALEEGPFRMRAWTFALRGPEAAWRRFWEPLPAPEYADLFALARYGHARIEGDVGPFLGSLRYVKEIVALPGAILREAAS